VEPCPEAVQKLRASLFVIGALVGCKGEAIVQCPTFVTYTVAPLISMCVVWKLLEPKLIRQGKVHIRAMDGKHLVNGNFCLDYPSVGATETLMMAAALADGKTLLSNVAQMF